MDSGVRFGELEGCGGVCVGCVRGGGKSPCWWVFLLVRSGSFQEGVCCDKVAGKITCCSSVLLCGSVLGGGVDWWGIVEIGDDGGSCCWLCLGWGCWRVVGVSTTLGGEWWLWSAGS